MPNHVVLWVTFKLCIVFNGPLLKKYLKKWLSNGDQKSKALHSKLNKTKKNFYPPTLLELIRIVRLEVIMLSYLQQGLADIGQKVSN